MVTFSVVVGSGVTAEACSQFDWLFESGRPRTATVKVMHNLKLFSYVSVCVYCLCFCTVGSIKNAQDFIGLDYNSTGSWARMSNCGPSGRSGKRTVVGKAVWASTWTQNV